MVRAVAVATGGRFTVLPMRSMRLFPLFALLFSLTAHAVPPPVDAALARALVPQKLRPDAVPKALTSVQAAIRHQKCPQACTAIVAHHRKLLAEAAPLFYQPDRRRGGDEVGVTLFLAKHVDGPAPELQIVAESFVPAPGVRALGVDACLRAGQAREAEMFVRDLAMLHGDAQARLTLALLRAVTAGQWPAGAAVLEPTQTGPRVTLLRALAGEAPGPKPLLAQAAREAATPEEHQLVAEVAHALGLPVPEFTP